MIALPTKKHLIFRVVWQGMNLLLADSRLRVPCFQLREHALRAGVAFFSIPEIKQ